MRRRRNQVVTAPDWQARLQARQLDSVEAVYALQTGRVLKPARRRKCGVSNGSNHGLRRELYVKKYWYPNFRDRWSGMYRGTFFGTSKVRREFENLARLRAWGLDAPVPVAYGEERPGGVVASVVLISEGIHDPLSLDLSFATGCRCCPRRNGVKCGAKLIRRLAVTRGGCTNIARPSRLLLAKHTSQWPFAGAFLPHRLPQGRCWKPWMEMHCRAKDLATLDAPAPSFFRRTERLRFFLPLPWQRRLTRDDKHLLRHILRVAQPMRSAELQRVQRAQLTSTAVKG